MITPRQLWVRTGQVQLKVLDWGGTGHPLLCLHGIAANAWLWNTIALRLVEDLGDSHRVLSVDLRGHGDSSKPAEGPYTPEVVGEDLLGLCDALGAEQMSLMGHSRGGWQSAYVAARWPERVRDLILVDPARFSFEAPQDSVDYYGGISKLLGPFDDTAQALATARAHEPRAIWTRDREEAFLQGLEATEDGRLRGKIPPPILAALQAVRERDWLTDIADRITARTLLFVATLSDARRQAQKMEYAEKLPNVQVVKLPTTHYVHYDATEDARRAIVEFITAGQAASQGSPSTGR